MFPFPQNTHGGLPPQEPAAGSRSHASRGRWPAQAVPRVAKSQLLRRALAERMCDIGTQQSVLIQPPVRSWQPAHGTEGIAVPLPAPTTRLFPRWETMGYGDGLLMIKAFAKTCISSTATDSSAFGHTARGWKANRLGKGFLDVASRIEACPPTWLGDVRLDPQVQLAVEVFHQVGLGAGTVMGPVGQVERWFAQGYAVSSVAVLVNAFIDDLRKHGRRIGMGRKMQSHESTHAARERGVRSYLRKALKCHPDCSFMRFELCMGRNTESSRREEFAFMREASAQYLHGLKRLFGDAIVADVRKIDRGGTSDYLVYVLLALDGPHSYELAAIRHAFAEQWNDQTKGIGYLIDCDAVDAFMYRGAASLSCYGESTASQLINAVTFLADTDSMIQVGFGSMCDGLILGTVSDRPSP